MKTRARFVACFALLPAAGGIAAEVPTFQSGEYQVTTSFGDSETLQKKVCLTNYTDWFDSLRDDFKERGCNLVAEGQEGAVYRYRMDCSNGTTGTLAVKKHSDSHFESLAEVELPIAGFTQTISMRDVARRIGECPPEWTTRRPVVRAAGAIRAAFAPMLCGFSARRMRARRLSRFASMRRTRAAR